jgi:hypothetical protein
VAVKAWDVLVPLWQPKGGSSFGNPNFDDADGVKVANCHIQRTTIYDRVVIGGLEQFVKIWQSKPGMGTVQTVRPTN